MPYGYLGQNLPNQTRSNSGVFSISDVADLEKQGKFGGSLELIAQDDFSSVTDVDFLNIKEDIYDVHVLHIEKIFHESATNTGIRLYESGVLESSSVYKNAGFSCQSTGTFAVFGSNTNTRLNFGVTNNGGTGTDDNESGYAYFYNLGNSSLFSTYTYVSVVNDVGANKNHYGGGVLPQASLVDGIRINLSATSSGVAKLYGVKQK